MLFCRVRPLPLLVFIVGALLLFIVVGTELTMFDNLGDTLSIGRHHILPAILLRMLLLMLLCLFPKRVMCDIPT